jgi:hypothetical protein
MAPEYEAVIAMATEEPWTAIRRSRLPVRPNPAGESHVLLGGRALKRHLDTASRYGRDNFRERVYAVCSPAISNYFPRRWFRAHPAKNALSGTRNTSDYLDRFGNHMMVLGVANPRQYRGVGLEGLRYRATGYSILRCNREAREVQVAVWPRWVDPSAPGAKPYPGRAIIVRQLDNGLHGAPWALEKIETPGQPEPVVQVQKETGREVVCTVRIQGKSFTPRVSEPGTYTLIAFDPDGGYRQA